MTISKILGILGIFTLAVVILPSQANAATVIYGTPSGAITSDTGNDLLLIINTNNELAAGEEVVGWLMTNSTAGTVVADVIPAIFHATGGGNFEVASLAGGQSTTNVDGSSPLPWNDTTASGSSGTGNFTVPAGGGYFGGFLMDRPTGTEAAGGALAPILHDDGGGSVSFLQGATSLAEGSTYTAANLARTYNFAIVTESIPEPSSALLAMLGLGLCVRRRRP